MARRTQLAQLEQTTKREIVKLRTAGASLGTIAAELNKRGLIGAQGGRWYAGTVRYVIKCMATNNCAQIQR